MSWYFYQTYGCRQFLFWLPSGSNSSSCCIIFSRCWVSLGSLLTLLVVPGISLGCFPVTSVGVSEMLAIFISGPPGLPWISSCQPIALLLSLVYASPSAAISFLFVFCGHPTMPLLLSRCHVSFLQLSFLCGFSSGCHPNMSPLLFLGPCGVPLWCSGVMFLCSRVVFLRCVPVWCSCVPVWRSCVTVGVPVSPSRVPL